MTGSIECWYRICGCHSISLLRFWFEEWPFYEILIGNSLVVKLTFCNFLWPFFRLRYGIKNSVWHFHRERQVIFHTKDVSTSLIRSDFYSESFFDSHVSRLTIFTCDMFFYLTAFKISTASILSSRRRFPILEGTSSFLLILFKFLFLWWDLIVLMETIHSHLIWFCGEIIHKIYS